MLKEHRWGLRPRSFYAVVAYWRKTQVISLVGWLHRHRLLSARSHNELAPPRPSIPPLTFRSRWRSYDSALIREKDRHRGNMRRIGSKANRITPGQLRFYMRSALTRASIRTDSLNSGSAATCVSMWKGDVACASAALNVRTRSDRETVDSAAEIPKPVTFNERSYYARCRVYEYEINVSTRLK